jgi:hypothetical protein
MMKNKVILVLIIGMFLINLIVAQEASYCSEKTIDGAWCQNVPEAKIDANYRSAPTSCDATSFCKSGCCYDSSEGTCMRNTPQIVCENDGGVWSDSASCEVPQCELGCCLIGNQAAFVSQQRCKRLSSLYALDINFRTDIANEIQCILSTTSEVKGACVFEEEFETRCQFLSKAKCFGLGSANVSFHEDYLCTADELNTICAKTEKTTCVDGRDEVFFVDSCGNVANIYDASKKNDAAYWTKIVDKGESCGAGGNNGDSAVCGNCDYYLGSTCKEYNRGADKRRPQYGDNICRNLDCELDGVPYQHGETFCANSKGTDESLPGSRNFRLVCYNGEISVEPCADRRAEVCLESDIDGFKTAACRANRWQDCTKHTLKKDCENKDRRDCEWIGGTTIKCVPAFAPGFDFWSTEESGEAEEICSTASVTCKVTCAEGLTGDVECESFPDGCGDEEGLDSGWEAQQDKVCQGLGDCDGGNNYIGVEGFNSEDEE